MADEGEEIQGMEDSPASRDAQEQRKALDSITDHVEERQLDSKRVDQAIKNIAAEAEADRNAQRLREKELAAVKINQSDVDIIVKELEVDKKVAERTLREHKGDAVAALRSFLK